MSGLSRCELCGRQVAIVTKHHLIPRTRHKNKRNKKNFDRDEIHSRVLWLCSPCHKNVHAVLTEKELENTYNTVELLAEHPEISKFTDWIKTKPDGTTVRVHASKSKSQKWK